MAFFAYMNHSQHKKRIYFLPIKKCPATFTLQPDLHLSQNDIIDFFLDG